MTVSLKDIFFDGDTNFIHYNMKTSEAQSGSGVYYHDTDTGEYFVVAVHVLGQAEYKSGTWITQERFQQIQQWIQSENQRIDIEERDYLNIPNLGLKDEALEEKLRIFCKSDEKSRMKRVNLSKNYLSEHAIFIIISPSWDFLEDINLSGNRLQDAEVKQLAHNITRENLIKLDLSDNEISDDGAKAIAKNKTWKNLATLLLNNNKIGDKGATAIAESKSWPNLKTFSLAGNNIKEDGAISIAENENT